MNLKQALKNHIKLCVMEFDKKHPNNTVENTVEAFEELSIELQTAYTAMMNEDKDSK